MIKLCMSVPVFLPFRIISYTRIQPTGNRKACKDITGDQFLGINWPSGCVGFVRAIDIQSS